MTEPHGDREIGKSYRDIVAAEFRKNRAAVIALRVIVVLFALAVLAPFLVNGRPYRIVIDGQVEYPLFASTTRTEWIVLLAGVCAAGAWAAVRIGSAGRPRHTRARIRRAAVWSAIGLFLASSSAVWFGLKERMRHPDEFRRLVAEGRAQGAWFAPVPFSFESTDPARINRPPSLGAAYGLDKPTLRALDREGVPADVRERLAEIGDARFYSHDALHSRLAELLSPQELAAHGSKIFAAADFGGHFLGTDKIGGDVLARLVYGSRTSLAVGFVAVGISVFIGVVYGSIMGYFGGRVDFVMMRIIEIVMSIPTFFLIITIVAFWPRNLFNIMVVIGITGWPNEARFIRAEFLKLRRQDFVSAAEALGVPSTTIMFRHMLPNGIAPVLVDAAFGVGSAVFIEASLSFLGFGPGPDVPSWGAMLSESFSDSGLFLWWMSMFPGAAIFITVLSYNLVGEGLRDAVDPRLRKAAA
jgi:peptide/nickel transport system permease protein